MSEESLEDRERRILEHLDDRVRQVDDEVRQFLDVPSDDSNSPTVNWSDSDLDGLNGFYRWYHSEYDDADEITMGRHHEADTLFHELVHYHGDIQEWNELSEQLPIGNLEEGLTELLTDEYYGQRIVRCEDGRRMADALLEGLEQQGYSHEEATALLANLHQDPAILPTVLEAAGVSSLEDLAADLGVEVSEEAASDEQSLEDEDDADDEETATDDEDEDVPDEDGDEEHGEDGEDLDDEADEEELTGFLDPDADELEDEELEENDESLEVGFDDDGDEDDEAGEVEDDAEYDDEGFGPKDDGDAETDEVGCEWDQPLEEDSAEEEEFHGGDVEGPAGDDGGYGFDGGYESGHDEEAGGADEGSYDGCEPDDSYDAGGYDTGGYDDGGYDDGGHNDD
ncbi:MAG: hypothetical protein PVJ57_22100 [Phycisphaerae bacterium]|jgi:hypothetical protein